MTSLSSFEQITYFRHMNVPKVFLFLFLKSALFSVISICLVLHIVFLGRSASPFSSRSSPVSSYPMRNCTSLVRNYGDTCMLRAIVLVLRNQLFSDILKRWNMRKCNFSLQPEGPQWSCTLRNQKDTRHRNYFRVSRRYNSSLLGIFLVTNHRFFYIMYNMNCHRIIISHNKQ